MKKRTFVLLISFLIFFEIWNILLFFIVPDNRKVGIVVFCKNFLHNIAKKKYTPLRLKFFSDYFGLDRAFLSRKLSPVKLKMCA